MSLRPTNSLPSRFSPVRHDQPARAPIERVERSADLLGAPPQRSVTYHNTAAAALSGPDAVRINPGPAVPLYAPGATVDAWA